MKCCVAHMVPTLIFPLSSTATFPILRMCVREYLRWMTEPRQRWTKFFGQINWMSEMGVKTFHHYTNAFGRYATHNRFDTFSYQNVDIIDENRIQFIVYNYDNIQWSVWISTDANNINPNYTFRQLFSDVLRSRWIRIAILFFCFVSSSISTSHR